MKYLIIKGIFQFFFQIILDRSLIRVDLHSQSEEELTTKEKGKGSVKV
jgi:hypothetical protein